MVKMKLYNTFNIKKNHKNSIILIGNFDGLHPVSYTHLTLPTTSAV